MTQQQHDDTPLGTPNPPDVDPAEAALIKEPSIVDSLLNLDEFLSGEVRLAEKTARFCTEPQLEADIDELEAELAGLVDAQGRPLAADDESLAGQERTARVVALELQAKRHAYAAAVKGIRMRQLPEDDWRAFRAKHREAFATVEDTPGRRAMLDDLIVQTAARPKISPTQLTELRKRIGSAVVGELIEKAWLVNTESGVNIPKSRLSSAVLRQSEHSLS